MSDSTKSDNIPPPPNAPKWYVQAGENDIRGPCDTESLKSLLKSLESEDKENLEHLEENTYVEGAVLTEEEEAKKRKREKKKLYLKRKKQRMESGEIAGSLKSHTVYVSGLPKDTTISEVAEVFKKAGLIKIDPHTTLPKIKLYTDEKGELKSDGTVTFVNKESIDLAIRYLDNYHFRDNCIIHVEQAKFEPRSAQIKPIPPSIKSELRKKYLAAKYEEKRLQGWSDTLDDGTGRRIVISKPMFSMDDAMKYEAGDEFYDELKEEILSEIKKYVEVEKVTPIPRHPQGVVCIKFKNSSDAEVFISKFNGRMFDGRELEVYFFDGKTDLQAQTIPSNKIKKPVVETKLKEDEDDDVKCDWVEEQSSDEEFEIKTE
uniref:RNA binding protein, putative n=1 Tax=Theileria annulata TaxID=5874 RepID=A0A3B0MJ91_THEAN